MKYYYFFQPKTHSDLSLKVMELTNDSIGKKFTTPKVKDNIGIIFTISAGIDKGHVLVSWTNKNGGHDSVPYSTENVKDAFNIGEWVEVV